MQYTILYKAYDGSGIDDRRAEVDITDIENEQIVKNVIKESYKQMTLFHGNTQIKAVDISVFKGSQVYWQGKSSVKDQVINPSIFRFYQ
jgi:hypothetical protein